MKKIAASKFKEQCLAILEKIGSEGLVITKHGKPIAKLLPIEVEWKDLIGSLKNKVVIHEDILSTSLKWNAES